jgi:cholesterol transport system auxiliary component
MKMPSMVSSRHGLRALLCAACLVQGCALMSKGEARTPRYFSPALEAARAPAAERGERLDLRLGPVESAAHLEERIAYRVSDTELGYYDDRLWTEPPEQFVRRALESELFEKRAFRRVISGPGPTLDVEVLSFEELREGAPRARLTLLTRLRDERRVLLERTVSVEAPLAAGAEDAGPALALAMANALASATQQIADQVGTELQKRDGASPVAAHGDTDDAPPRKPAALD